MKPIALGGLSIAGFLRRHWQKQPLLVRDALPGFGAMLEPRDLMALAACEEAESRLVTVRRGKWEVRHGPFTLGTFDRLPARGWSLLVQGVNHFLPEADALLRRFDFIPYARLDDLMVSFAPPGGGVGPHFDSYDVFLLQGSGRRRWQISGQRDRALVKDAPLRILRRFRPEQEWVLDPGDMLYLPPRYAHDGIAATDCMTYSVGFRAPSHQELATRFLAHLDDRIRIEGMYADPGLRAARRPARIPPDMLRSVSKVLKRIRWRDSDIVEFLGCFLTEPKPHVYFRRPARPASPRAFLDRVRRHGARLDLKTLMLFTPSALFINGEKAAAGHAARGTLSRLADARCLPPGSALATDEADLLYRWYRDGYICPER
ncbi:MAG: cupin domain-containing protein [Betaproteobacteria bacterium]|nr:cupin domain-containing protein [Betaproteobacteria bacterium]